MKLYNTLTKNLEEFKPIKKGEVGIYSCGPTVYWNQHIGHMYAFVQFDVLVRFLRSIGNKVKWVMNITDVGHMTSDEDAGEDKMEKGAKREGISVWDVADKYIGQFKDSLKLLGVITPDVLCRATEHIAEQIELVKKIEANGFTYKTKTGLVFDTGKFVNYAKFAGLKLNRQEAGARVNVDPEKKYPWDFLLWITNKPDHIMKWDSPWGVGFPGWHVECTAMSIKYLGENFDIHTGGKEHIPVHHTNEIAQGFGAFGHQTANYWLHNEWLVLKGGEKMSKSKGNFTTAQDLLEKGYDPLAMRYLILNSQYRKGLQFSFEALDAAQTALKNLRNLIAGLKSGRSTLSVEKNRKREEYENKFNLALSEDINVPQGLAVLWEMLKSNLPSSDKLELAEAFDQVLGLKLGEEISESKVPEEITLLARKREDLRKAGEFKKADELRSQIEKSGFLVFDTSSGFLIKAKS